MSVVDETLCPKAKKCGTAIRHRRKELVTDAGMIAGEGRRVSLAQKATHTILIASMDIGITTPTVMTGLLREPLQARAGRRRICIASTFARPGMKQLQM
jgi:hypothetical protein